MKFQSEIYLDSSSTTPPRTEVLKRIAEIYSYNWANPSSIHLAGIKAAEEVERSRITIGKSINADEEDIIFTSGATESIHLGLIGTARKLAIGRIVISSIEHPSVIGATNQLKSLGWEVNQWPVDKEGNLQMEYIDKLLAPPTKILSIIWAQSEIGTLQDIIKIGQECRSRNIIFHTDATQFLSQNIINWRKLPVDLLSASAHKFQGPKGVGILLNRSNKHGKIEPLLQGGAQEHGQRSGTPPVALISSMSLAFLLLGTYDKEQYFVPNKEAFIVSNITRQLRSSLSKIENIKFTGNPTDRLSNHISMLVSNNQKNPLAGNELVRRLSYRGISASSGTACLSNKNIESHVLRSIGYEQIWTESGLRFSLGPWNRYSDINRIVQILVESINELS